MIAISDKLWGVSWDTARNNSPTVIHSNADNIVWDKVRFRVDEIIVDQVRDNLWHEVRYYDAST